MKRFSKFFIIFYVIYSMSQALYSEQRIVSLSPISTEILFDLGLGEQIVGVTRYCTFPIRAQKIEKIGDVKPDYEQLLSLNPDFVVGVGLGKLVEGKLRQLNIHTYHYDMPATMEDLFQLYRDLGQDLDVLPKAKDKVLAFEELMPPKILVLTWVSPFSAASDTSFLHEIVELAGYRNVLESNLEFPKLNFETIMTLDPDVILLTGPGVKKQFQTNKRLIEWVKKQNIQIIDDIHPDLLLRAGPRSFLAIQLLKDKKQ